MSTTVTPPDPASEAAASAPVAPAPDASRPVRASSRAVAIVAIALGAVVVLGTAAGTVIPAALGGVSRTDTLTASAGGAQSLVVDASGGSVRIAFGSVPDAELSVTGLRGADGWSLRRDGDELVVESDHEGRRSGFFDGAGFGGFWGRSREAVLTLPRALEGRIDADLSLAGGGLEVDGGFDDLALDVAGGSADVRGAAGTLVVGLQAGSADIRLADVRTADLSIEAGSLDARLTGAAPEAVAVSATAGSASVSLPDAPYAVTRSVSAGHLDNRLDTSPSAPRTVTVDISGGSVDLRPSR